jgi:hypothetical protein
VAKPLVQILPRSFQRQLERHFKIGGLTHTFTRPGGWSWDVGLHYVGEMGEGMMGRRLFDFITGGGMIWNPMPDVYDVFALSRSGAEGIAPARAICAIGP